MGGPVPVRHHNPLAWAMGNESSTARGWDRPSIDKVRPGLYCGGMAGALRHADLKRVGVTHVLCMADYDQHGHAFDRDSFVYKVLRAQDTPSFDISRHFDEIDRFIAAGRSSGGAVYVHCMAGVSRAAVAILVHLMRSERVALIDAFNQLKAVRPCVQPNSGFWNALILEEKRLQQSTTPDSFSQTGDRAVAETSPVMEVSVRYPSRQRPLQPGIRGHPLPRHQAKPAAPTADGRRRPEGGRDLDGTCSAPRRRQLAPFGQVRYGRCGCRGLHRTAPHLSEAPLGGGGGLCSLTGLKLV